MSRPTRKESICQVSIHRNGGYMYASTHPYTTDGKTGKRKYVNLHWGNVEDVDSVLTLAYFSVLTGYSYNRVACWQRIEKYLTQNITESDRMKLFSLRAARLSDNAVCAVDSTTRSAYGDALADIKWGKNKEGRSRCPSTLTPRCSIASTISTTMSGGTVMPSTRPILRPHQTGVRHIRAVDRNRNAEDRIAGHAGQ